MLRQFFGELLDLCLVDVFLVECTNILNTRLDQCLQFVQGVSLLCDLIGETDLHHMNYSYRSVIACVN